MQTQLGLIWRLAGARAPLPWEMSAEKAAEGLRGVVRRRRGMLMPTLSLHGNANANATARQPHARGISKHAAVAPRVGCPCPAVRPMLPPAWPKDGYSCRRWLQRTWSILPQRRPGGGGGGGGTRCFPVHTFRGGSTPLNIQSGATWRGGSVRGVEWGSSGYCGTLPAGWCRWSCEMRAGGLTQF